MESGDGGWIRAGGTQADEDAGYQARSAQGWPAATAGPPAGPSIGTSAGNRWGHGGIPGFSAWVAAAVAVAAVAAGVVVGFFLVKGGVLPGCNRGRGSMGGMTSGRVRRVGGHAGERPRV
jgi:hypothetical protein